MRLGIANRSLHLRFSAANHCIQPAQHSSLEHRLSQQLLHFCWARLVSKPAKSVEVESSTVLFLLVEAVVLHLFAEYTNLRLPGPSLVRRHVSKQRFHKGTHYALRVLNTGDRITNCDKLASTLDWVVFPEP